MTPIHRAGPFRAVLCPVDFSAHSRAALRYAAALATRAGAPLSVLYVNDPLLVAAAAAAYDERALAARSTAELRQFVRKTLGHRTAAPIATITALGQPAEAIRRAVRQSHADLVVIGSAGLSGAPRLLFGSTTARVLAHTGVPVLAIPPGRPARTLTRWPGARVLAAIELGRRAPRDVAAARTVARWFDARLALVHVLEPTRTPRWLSINRGAHDRERERLARRHLQRLAGGHRDDGARDTVETHLAIGSPADQIAALAADLGAGLVILTLHGRDRLLGDHQGATTYRLVCHAATPVLALPEGWTPPGERQGGR